MNSHLLILKKTVKKRKKYSKKNNLISKDTQLTYFFNSHKRKRKSDIEIYKSEDIKKIISHHGNINEPNNLYFEIEWIDESLGKSHEWFESIKDTDILHKYFKRKGINI
jgi:hypothetical protein